MVGTADVPYQIADAHLPSAVSVFEAATALDTAMPMADPQLTLVELLVRHGLLPRERLPQIEINSDALVMLVEGDDIGDGFFVTVIVTDDELQFDAHTGASPGSSGQ